jgi:hypothetical protein
MWAIYLTCAATLGVALLTDDAVRQFLKIPHSDYYALLIAVACSVVFGGVLLFV